MLLQTSDATCLRNLLLGLMKAQLVLLMVRWHMFEVCEFTALRNLMWRKCLPGHRLVTRVMVLCGTRRTGIGASDRKRLQKQRVAP